MRNLPSARKINSGFRWVKMCATCKKDRFREDFRENSKTTDGLSYCCLKCEKHSGNTSRLKSKGVSGAHTIPAWEAKCEQFGHRCCYCGIFCGDGITKDHFVPTSLGGSNDISNIYPCCHNCNARKGKSLPIPWIMKTFGEFHPMMKRCGK
jgi:5-methylcytosine-specific restriction endonuclease McrA